MGKQVAVAVEGKTVAAVAGREAAVAGREAAAAVAAAAVHRERLLTDHKQRSEELVVNESGS